MNTAGRFTIGAIVAFLLLEGVLLGATLLYNRVDFGITEGRDGPDFLFAANAAAPSSVFQRIGRKQSPPLESGADMIFSEEEQSFLQLVNKTNPLDKEFKPDDLTAIKYYVEDRSPDGRFMRAKAAKQFHLMIEAAERKDLVIRMTTAYRSYGFQDILWNQYVNGGGEDAANTYSAKPGESEHQTGLAVDVTSKSVDNKLTEKFGETKEGKWLAENAHLYGFILRYPKGSEEITGYQYEPWHFRFVGKRAAAEIFRRGITLEEFYTEVFNAAQQ
jgi:D-alanyl-D-alanine carboxypeptidase